MDDRAYALFVVKGLDLERRVFSGIASTPDLDRQGHSIDPAGVSFRNPLPLLFHHNQEQPIGTVTLTSTAAGIAFEASMPVLTEPGALKNRVDEAWQSIKAGLITGVSIGLRVLDRTIVGDVLKILKSEILELSLVTIPANAQANILTVKSLAALGPHSSGVADPIRPVRATKAALPMTTKEQITALETTRASKVAMMSDLMSTAAAAGVTLDASQAEKYDALDLEVKSVTADLLRYQSLEKAQLMTATRIEPPNGNGNGTNPVDVASSWRGGTNVVTIKPNVPKGTAFVRGAIAILQARGNKVQAVEIAKQWRDSTPEVELWLKAAVAPGSTTDPAWAGALAAVNNLTNEFIELLRPATILGRVEDRLRKVPFNTAVPNQTAGGVYGWVGQNAPKAVTRLTFGSDTLTITKAAGIIVLTEELVRVSNPSAEDRVRKDMIAGIAAFLDQQFIDPAVAPVANINPGSITNGTTAIATTGNPAADVHALISAFTTQGVPLSGSVLVMSEGNAFTMGYQRDAGGGRYWPSMSAQGGTAEGVTVITSNAAGTNVVLFQPEYILFADDGGVEIDVSREATIQMDSAPMAPDATTVQTSLWQNNLVGLRAERFVNWKRVVMSGVKYVSGATYVPALGVFGYTPPPEGGTQSARKA